MQLKKALGMRNLLMAALVMGCLQTMGQVHYVGVQGGLNLSNCTENIKAGDKRYKAGLVSGFNYEYRIRDKYTIGADLLYSQQGFNDLMTFLIEPKIQFPLSGPDYRETEVRMRYNYLSLPLKVGYTRGEQLKGFVKAGLSPSLLIASGIKLLDDDFPFEPKKLNLYDDVPKFDLGALVEAGAGYVLNEQTELFSSLSYRRSFTTISKEGHLQGAGLKHYLFSLSFGVRYRLKG